VNARTSLESATDAQLAALTQSGDRAAFDEIVRRHGPFALRVALRLCHDRAAAEDAAQDAMLRVWHQIHRYDPEIARFSTWLYRITVNLCIDQSRKWRGVALPEGYDETDPSPDGEQTLAALETSRSLAAGLRRLPARQRAAMLLVYEEGLSGAEAARVLGFSPKAVERLLARAREQLRKALGSGGMTGLDA
jgi:RNA polymerase sigma-70 factor (ECF subfamily)